MASNSSDNSSPDSPWSVIGRCLVVAFVTALIYNTAEHAIFVQISPDYYRLSPFPGLHTHDVRFDALIEGVVTGLWQGLVLGITSGLAIVRTSGRYSFSVALKVILGGFIVATALGLLVGPAMLLNNLQIGAGPKTPGFDLLKDSLQTPLCVVAYLVRIENPIVMLAAMVPGAVVLASMDKSATTSMRTRRLKQRQRSAAELRHQKRWVIAFLLAQLTPCVVAAIGIYFPLMPVWIPRAAFGIYLASMLVVTNALMDTSQSLQVESPRPRITTYLSILIWIASAAFALSVSLLGLNHAVSQTTMVIAALLVFGRIFLLAAIDARANRRTKV